MTTRKQPEQPSFAGLIVLLCVGTVLGLTVADFTNDGTIDNQLLIGAVIVFALAFGGFKVDRLLDRWLR